MSWRTFNDSQVLTESWTKITTHSHIQNSIDLLTEDIRKGQSELHTIEEGLPGRLATWAGNRIKGYGNMAKNIGKNIGNVAHGGASEGGINVRGQFDLDQLQSVWKNFHTDVFKMLPKEKMVAQYPEINKAIDDLANAIAGLNVGAGETPPSGEAPAGGEGSPEGGETPPEGGEVPPGEDTGDDGYNMPGGYQVGGPDGEPPGGAVDVPPQTLPGSETPPEGAPPSAGKEQMLDPLTDAIGAMASSGKQITGVAGLQGLGKVVRDVTGQDLRSIIAKDPKIKQMFDAFVSGAGDARSDIKERDLANYLLNHQGEVGGVVAASYNPLVAKIGFMGDWGVL